MTFNLADFPSHSVDPYEIDVIHPSDFLLDLLDLAPSTVIAELEQQATANRLEPKTQSALLEALSKSGVPTFVDEIRRRTG